MLGGTAYVICGRISLSTAVASLATQLCGQSTKQYYIFQGKWANYWRVSFLPHAQNEVINSI